MHIYAFNNMKIFIDKSCKVKKKKKMHYSYYLEETCKSLK